MDIESRYASRGRNFYASLNEGFIIVKGKVKDKKVVKEYIISDGDVIESVIKEGCKKIHILYGKFVKEYTKGKIIEEHYYSGGWRMKEKGLFYRKVEKKYIIERYSSGGSMCREMVYYKNGQLMYNLGKGNKNIKIFNPDSTLFAKIKLSKPLRLSKDGYNIHLNLKNLKNLTYTFSGRWYYEIYNHKGEVCSWLEGENGAPEKGVKNGKRLYFLRGIRVPKKIIDGKYDAKFILSYPNVTIRSEMIKRYGINRIIQELQGETIEKNEEYELLRFPMPGGIGENKYMQVLKMKCPSTQIWYALRVPPECQNIHEAVNWTYGLSLREIREEKNAIEIISAT